MVRTILVPALALGAVLAVNGGAAADDGPARSGFGTTMTLGGQGTAAQAAAADDTELACCHRRYYCGYRGYYGGFGGYGYGGYRGYYGGYGGYYPRATPYYSYGGYGGYSNFGGYGSYYSYGGGYGGFYGIAGTDDDRATPAVSLAAQAVNKPVVTRAPAPAAAGDGTFRYDGGPADPVPQPKPDANPSGRVNLPATGLPVSLQKTKPASPYTYKAYGEK